MELIYQSIAEALPPLIMLAIILFAARKMVKDHRRAENISKHGWPPSHCDADGNINPYVEPNEEDHEHSNKKQRCLL